jgi:hypothetical protein
MTATTETETMNAARQSVIAVGWLQSYSMATVRVPDGPLFSLHPDA